MLRKYMYFDRTRIFGPEWKMAQQWVAIDVSGRNSMKFGRFS